MEAFDEIKDKLRQSMVGKFPVEMVSEVESIICVTLGRYDIKEKETGLVVYDAGDTEIVQKFFLAKAIQGCTVGTARTYNAFLSAFLKDVPRHIKDITTDDIRLYIAIKKMNNCKDAYLATIHRVLSSFFTWCTAEGIIQVNPMLRVEKIKVRKKIEAALTDEQMEMIRYACRSKRESALVEFLYSTGCRISEACQLKRTDIDFEKGEVEVLGKGRKYRKVYLTQRAKFALKAYLDSRTDNNEALFVSDLTQLKGGLKNYTSADVPLQITGAQDLIRRIGKRCGLNGIHPHLFRKTVATHALRNGMPIDQVRLMLGHEDIATTTIYAQTHTDDVKRAHEKFV